MGENSQPSECRIAPRFLTLTAVLHSSAQTFSNCRATHVNMPMSGWGGGGWGGLGGGGENNVEPESGFEQILFQCRERCRHYATCHTSKPVRSAALDVRSVVHRHHVSGTRRQISSIETSDHQHKTPHQQHRDVISAALTSYWQLKTQHQQHRDVKSAAPEISSAAQKHQISSARHQDVRSSVPGVRSASPKRQIGITETSDQQHRNVTSAALDVRMSSDQQFQASDQPHRNVRLAALVARQATRRQVNYTKGQISKPQDSDTRRQVSNITHQIINTRR